MKRAAVVYRSRTGTTRRLAEEIGQLLRNHDIETVVASVGECDLAALVEVDYLLLGCWTNGWFVIRQHPDQPWIDFVRAMPPITRAKVGLFTTYTLATGSMFARMRQHLAGRTPPASLELKSRNGQLSEASRLALESFVSFASAPPG